MVYYGSIGRTSFEVSFPLRCFQRLSLPYLATRHCSWRYNRSTSGMFIPVLSRTRDNLSILLHPWQIGTELSHDRSEPSHRTTLIGEQPNPWDLLQPQDVMSRTSRCQTPSSIWTLRVSACYPRRTFYPLSDGPSTQNHRITMTVFRLCLTCQSRSQAGLCHCTLRTISDRSEPTFARLRYFLGRRPPQSNYPPYSVLLPDYGKQLDIKNNKRGISLTTP